MTDIDIFSAKTRSECASMLHEFARETCGLRPDTPPNMNGHKFAISLSYGREQRFDMFAHYYYHVRLKALSICLCINFILKCISEAHHGHECTKLHYYPNHILDDPNSREAVLARKIWARHESTIEDEDGNTDEDRSWSAEACPSQLIRTWGVLPDSSPPPESPKEAYARLPRNDDLGNDRESNGDGEGMGHNRLGYAKLRADDIGERMNKLRVEFEKVLTEIR